MAAGYSLNAAAASIVQRMIAGADALDIEAVKHGNGATVVDAGIRVAGSMRAGALFAETCLGGLGRVSFISVDVVPDVPMPAAFVEVSMPPLACLGSQYAGWSVRIGDFSAIGSGPARVLARVEELFIRLGYEERADVAVLLLEGRRMPDEGVTEAIAERCGVPPQRLSVVIAPTASVVGAVQVAARSVEAGLHKMLTLNFPVAAVTSAWGFSPIAPVGRDDYQALGWVNDCLLYGARAWYVVDIADEEVERVVHLLPSRASADHGLPFVEILRRAGDFYRIDPLLFGIAEVIVTNRRSGRTFRAGGFNPDALRTSLLGPSP